MMITTEEIAVLSSLRTEIKRLENEINQIDKYETSLSMRGYGGKPIPCREGIEIELDGNTTTPVNGTFVISSDGPFVATGIHFAFRWNDKTSPNYQYSGNWRPTSVPQFYWEYQVTGTNRIRQKPKVPSYVVERTEIGNGFFPLIPHDVFAKTSTVKITITLLSQSRFFSEYEYQGSVYPDGRMWIGFNGFYLLD